MEIDRDRLQLLEEKDFIGKEFLTWLWYESERQGGTVDVPGGITLSVGFERFITLDAGRGEARETVTCKGISSGLHEARTGLGLGKKVAKARMRIGRDESEWLLTMDGATMDITSLTARKGLSKVMDEEHDDLALEARVMERADMFFRALECMDLLFKKFLEVRLDREAWDAELKHMRRWACHA